jgi:hypothetical protein
MVWEDGKADSWTVGEVGYWYTELIVVGCEMTLSVNCYFAMSTGEICL